MLADLCRISNDVLTEALNDIGQRELVTIELLPNHSLKPQIEATVDLIKTAASMQVIATLNLLQVMYRSNALVSALGTNAHLVTSTSDFVFVGSTFYWTGYNATRNSPGQSCMDKNLIAPTGFYDEPPNTSVYVRAFWPASAYGEYKIHVHEMVDGFFGGCFAFDAVLASTLDCLYISTCLEILTKYFPRLNQVRLFESNEVFGLQFVQCILLVEFPTDTSPTR